MWDVYGDCVNTMVLEGHSGAVLEVAWSRDSQLLFSASTDRTGGVWDTYTGERVKKLRGHSSFVNTISATQRGPQLVATGSDDRTVRVRKTKISANKSPH